MRIRNAFIDFWEGLGFRIERDAIARGEANRRVAGALLRFEVLNFLNKLAQEEKAIEGYG